MFSFVSGIYPFNERRKIWEKARSKKKQVTSASAEIVVGSEVRTKSTPIYSVGSVAVCITNSINIKYYRFTNLIFLGKLHWWPSVGKHLNVILIRFSSFIFFFRLAHFMRMHGHSMKPVDFAFKLQKHTTSLRLKKRINSARNVFPLAVSFFLSFALFLLLTNCFGKGKKSDQKESRILFKTKSIFIIV